MVIPSSSTSYALPLKDPHFQAALTARKAEYLAMIAPIQKAMKLSSSTLHFKLIPEVPNTAVTMTKNKEIICVNVPILFFARKEDLTPSSPIGNYLKQFVHVLSKKEKKEWTIFKNLSANTEQWEKTKLFLLAHELAHICHGDMDRDQDSIQQFQKEETRADLTAAIYSNEIDAAIYYFEILDRYQTFCGTHPSFRARIGMLKKFQAQTKNIVASKSCGLSSSSRRSILLHVERIQSKHHKPVISLQVKSLPFPTKKLLKSTAHEST